MQVVVVATWKLLTLVEGDRIFSDVAFVWVDVIVGAIGTLGVLMGGVLPWVGLSADDPGAPLLLFLLCVGEFSERVGLTPANVAVIKNGRAKAVRFSTLEAMCRVLRRTRLVRRAGRPSP